MKTFNYEKLFVLRHGSYNREALDDKGKNEIEYAANLMLDHGLNNPTIISSEARRASESIFVIQDKAIEKDITFTTKNLFYYSGLWGESTYQRLEALAIFANEHRRSSNLLILTHIETVSLLPEWLLRKDFEIDYRGRGINNGEGAYIDLSNGKLVELMQKG